MKLLPSAVQAAKIGKVFSELGNAHMLRASAVMTTLFLTLWFCAGSNSEPNASMGVSISATFSAVVLLIFGVGKVLYRSRTINGEPFEPERYALIIDELRRRGVRNARRFIAGHPEHVRRSQLLSQELGWFDVAAYRNTMYQMEALIYSEDSEPERTKEALLSIIVARGVVDQNEARQLLGTILNTEPALSAGAL